MIFFGALFFCMLFGGGITISINSSGVHYLPGLSNDLFDKLIVPFLAPAPKYLATLLCAEKIKWPIYCSVNKAWCKKFEPQATDISQAIYEYHILKRQPLLQYPLLDFIEDPIEDLVKSTYLSGSLLKKQMIGGVYCKFYPDVNACFDLVEKHAIYHLDAFSKLLMHVNYHKEWLACYELALKRAKENKLDLHSITICYSDDLESPTIDWRQSSTDLLLMKAGLKNLKIQFNAIKNNYNIEDAILVGNKKKKIALDDFLLDLLQANQYERVLFLVDNTFEEEAMCKFLEPFFCKEGDFKFYFESNPEIFPRLIYDLIFKNNYEEFYFAFLKLLLSMQDLNCEWYRDDLYSLFMQETNDKYKKIVTKETINLSDEELYFVLMSYCIALRFENCPEISASYPKTTTIQKEIIQSMSCELKEACIKNIIARDINEGLVLKMQETLNLKTSLFYKCKKALEIVMTRRVLPGINSHIMSIICVTVFGSFALLAFYIFARVRPALRF